MKQLAINETVQVQGGLDKGQVGFLISMTVGFVGDAVLNAALKPLGVQTDGFVTKYFAVPAFKLAVTALGYEASNYVLQPS